MVNDPDITGSGLDRETYVLDPGIGNFLNRGQILANTAHYEQFGFTQNFLWYAPITRIAPNPSQHWSDCQAPDYRSMGTWCTTTVRTSSATHTVGQDLTQNDTLEAISAGSDWIALTCGNFGLPVTGDSPIPVIHGLVFNDANRDGIQDSGETGYGGGITFTLSRTSSLVGQANSSVLGTVTSDGSGNFSFSLNNNEGPGTYVLTEQYDSGWPNTTPLTVTINVPEGADNGENLPTAIFGVRQEVPPVAVARPESADQSSTQGAEVTLDGSASYSPTGDPITYTWTGPFGIATSGTPTVLMPAGTNNVTLTVSDGIKTDSTTAAVTVYPPITAHSTSISAIEGAPFTATVATFTDPDPSRTASQYAATIDYGDGTPTSSGTVTQPGGPGTPFVVTGAHTYSLYGNYAATVTVIDKTNAYNTARVQSPSTVADAPLKSTTPATTYATNPVNTVVGTFIDTDPNGHVSYYTATINWGDGSTSTGTVTGPVGGPFAVTGTHTYSANGPFSYIVTVQVCDVGGACTNTTTNLLLLHLTADAFPLQISLPGLPTQTLAETGPIDTTSAVSQSATVLSLLNPLLNATTLSSSAATTNTGAWSSTSTSSVESLDLGLLGLPAITATLVRSQSVTSCSASSGSASIGSLEIAGNAITLGKLTPNLTLSVPTLLGSLTLVLDEQMPVPGGLRVDAIHITGPLGLNVIVSSATSDIHNCP